MFRDLWKYIVFATPLLLKNAIQLASGTILVILIEKIGIDELPAYSMAMAIYNFKINLFSFLVAVTTSHVSRCMGEKNQDKAAEWIRLALVAGLISGLFVALLLWALKIPLFLLFRFAEGDRAKHVKELASTYYDIRLLSVPSQLVLYAAVGVLQGLQQPNVVLILIIFQSILDIGLNALFILQYNASLALSGWTTTAVYNFTTVVALVYLSLQNKGVPRHKLFNVCYSRRETKEPVSFFQKSMAYTYFTDSLKLAIRSFVLMFVGVLGPLVAASLGVDQLSAFQIIGQVYMWSSYCTYAIGSVGNMLGSKYIQAKEVAKYKRLQNMLPLIGLTVGLIIGGCLWIFEDQLIQLFTQELHNQTDLPALLRSVWIYILVVAQPIISVKSVYEGLVNSRRAYGYLLICSISGLFIASGPLYLIAYFLFRTLIYVCIAKASFDVFTLVLMMLKVLMVLPPELEAVKQREEEELLVNTEKRAEEDNIEDTAETAEKDNTSSYLPIDIKQSKTELDSVDINSPPPNSQLPTTRSSLFSL